MDYRDPYRDNPDRVQPLPGTGMHGLGLFGVDLPDFIEKPLDFAVDTGAAVVTGGATLALPSQPSSILEHPGDALGAAGGFLSNVDLKNLLRSGGKVLGETLKTVGGGYNQPIGGAAAAAPKPSFTDNVKKYGPWVVGGLAALGLGYMLLSD